MSSLLSFDESALRALVAEEVARALGARGDQADGWLDVQAASEYLCTTKAALRSMLKRGQVAAHRSATGRVLFRASDLDEHVLGGSA